MESAYTRRGRVSNGVAAGGCPDRGGGAVGEDRVGDGVLRVAAVLEVQGAKLGAAEQHTVIRLALGKGIGDAQAVDRTVAAHEAEVRSRHRGVQLQPIDELVIEPRCVEAGAGHGDEVGDGGRVGAAIVQRPAAGLGGEGGRVLRVRGHALLGAGRLGVRRIAEEACDVFDLFVCGWRVLAEDAVALGDFRAAVDALDAGPLGRADRVVSARQFAELGLRDRFAGRGQA